MPQWLPSIRYPPSQDGYWGPITSTLNWCEEDYYATIYSAEIINTLTNLLFVFLAIKGILNCRKHGHDGIFLVTFCGYACVGVGSFLFHTTLKYPMQLVDELSMIYTTCLMCYAVFSFSRSTRFRAILAIALILLSVFITLYYHYLQDPVFHQNAYAILTATVLFRMMYVMEFKLRPSLRKRNDRVHSHEEDERDRKILKTMWIMIAYGLGIFLGGFVIWVLDNKYCLLLRTWRREVGLPWGFLLECHGWWHLMTGTGAYFYIVWAIWLRHVLNGRENEYELVWPRMLTSFPEVVRTDIAANQKGQ